MDDTDAALKKIGLLVTANTKNMSMLGARAMVLGKFLEVALPQLTPAQRAEVSRAFRLGIEDLMSLMDDVPLPAGYHSTLLELTNGILAALSQGSVASQ
ncbi:hypothetical protein [Paraburkholderia heleia]|uniref:hypothetical protein n=1 Tax=Paraburkholderia heleia TaxID=634127 RepID=UPI0005A8D3E9|nr:hypothetical protein [Paraburkholderia heleia]